MEINPLKSSTPESCKSCFPGMVLVNGACNSCPTTCSSCQANANNTALVCTACVAGTYLNNGQCTACALSGGAQLCSTCPNNVCTACNAGYYVNAGTCNQCQVGNCASCSDAVLIIHYSLSLRNAPPAKLDTFCKPKALTQHSVNPAHLTALLALHQAKCVPLVDLATSSE